MIKFSLIIFGCLASVLFLPQLLWELILLLVAWNFLRNAWRKGRK